MEATFNLDLDLSDMYMDSTEATLDVGLDVSQDPGPQVDLDLNCRLGLSKVVRLGLDLHVCLWQVTMLTDWWNWCSLHPLAMQTNGVGHILVSGRNSADFQ